MLSSSKHEHHFSTLLREGFILTIRHHLWRWLRFPLAIAAALLVGLLVEIVWLLSGQRYQHLLTQQLSALLGAEVSVVSSRLSLHHGLGIQLDTVAVQDGADSAPFFTADRLHVLLDISSLLHGRLLFRRVDCTKPRIRLFEQGGAQVRLLDRLLAAQGKTEPADLPVPARQTGQWLAGWLSPRFALQLVRLRGGEIAYGATPKGEPFVLTHTDASLEYATGEGVIVGFRAALGQDGAMGQIALWASTPTWDTYDALYQIEWQGEVHLSRLLVQPLGRLLGAEWPQMRLDLSGSYQGKWAGPVELAGEMKIGDARVGSVRVSEGKARLTKLLWSGQAKAPFALPALLRALVVKAQIEEVRGEIGAGNLPVILHKGEISLRDEELTASKIAGTYGTKSQITEGAGTLRRLFASDGPALDLRLVADLDLEEGVGSFLAAHSETELASFSQHLTQPRGRALVRLGLQAPRLRQALNYDGEVAFQQAGFHVSAWNLDVTDLSGSVRLNKEALTTDALTLKVGQSWLKVKGSVHDYLASQRSADLHLAFTAVRDQDLAPFLPQGLLLPQGGALSGQVGVVLPAQGGEVQTNGRVVLSQITLALLSFLQPIEVVNGEVTWQGQSGTFVVKQGRLPGGDFSGRGQLRSFTPLNIEVSADFADLNLESALAFDKSTAEDTSPKDTTLVVRADLTCGRLTYKTLRAEDLHLSCHWHGRQADLRIPEAKAEGGTIQGEAVLWPDIDALFLTPQLTNVNLPRFFSALGIPTDVLTGTLSGEGKIYMPNWHEWDSLARWDALLSLAVADGVAQRLPILVRLWSVLSLQGLLSFQFPSLPNEGLAFSSLTGDFAVGKGLAVTKNLSLNSSAVRIDAHGEIDLARRVVDLKTALVPLHGITSSVAKVPLAGELLARGADFVTTLTFRVSGPYDDPTVTPLPW